MGEMTSEMITDFTCDCGRRVPTPRLCPDCRRQRRLGALAVVVVLAVIVIVGAVRG